MSTSETPAEGTTPSTLAPTAPVSPNPASGDVATAAAVSSLRNLLNIVLVGLIILSVSLGVFLYREIQIAQRQTKVYVTQISAYKQFVEPKMNEFRSKLDAFSKVHPDFLPMYNKYFSTNATSGVPGVMSAPTGEVQPPPR